MDIWRYYAVTHADHVVCNPIDPGRIDDLIELLDLAPGAVVWEAACGKGELLVRIAERFAVRGIGIDASSFELEVARDRAATRVPDAEVRFIESDAASVTTADASADLAICLGASWIWDGHRGTLRQLRRIARPGGLVLVGEPYWIHEPDPAYLSATGMTADTFLTLEGNVAVGRDEGLTPLYLMPSPVEDWDRYEFLQLRAAERFAADHPDDPDVVELLERARRERDEYLRWGRDTVGWAIMLFRSD